jgi:hypothetical protein
MKFATIAATAAVYLCSALTVAAYAQHDEKQGDRKGEKQGGRQPEQHVQTPQGQAPRQPRPQQQERATLHPQQPQQPVQAPHEPPHMQQPQHTQQVQTQQHAQQQRQPEQQQRPEQQHPEQQRQQPQAQQRSILSQRQPQPQRTKQQAQSWQQQRGWLKKGGWQGHDTFQQDASRNWTSDHRSWAQRGGYGGYYIPQSRFNLYFGSQHFFRFRAAPVMYLGYPRFEYQGTSFLLLDPWPANWSQDWYESDDLYIDYDDGYYLYDRNYPQQRLAITILV